MPTDERSPKEKILKNVRKGLLVKQDTYPVEIDLESDVFTREDGDLVEIFSGNFIASNGYFSYCYNKFDFIDQFINLYEAQEWKSLICLEKNIQKLFRKCDFPFVAGADNVVVADLSVTGCDALIARTGTIAISSGNGFSRTASVFPPAHVVIAWSGQIKYDLRNFIPEYYSIPRQSSMLSFISGPSRTADIEKTLVLGAHGPKEVFVFYIDQKNQF